MHMSFQYLILIALSSLLIACGSGTGDSAATLPSTEPGGEVGETSSAGLWIDIANNEGLYDIFFTKDSSFGDCLIPLSSETTTGPTDCVIDILETDAYVQKVEIQFNIPKDMCDYVTVSPSWHWNYSSGYGPQAVSIRNNADGDMIDCLVQEEDNGWEACTTAIEVYEVGKNSVTCAYDYTSRETGPNCCMGTYKQTIHTDDNGNGAVDADESYSESTTSWGGDSKDCLGGIAQNSWSYFSKGSESYPVGYIEYVPTNGINDVIEIPSNAQNIASSFQYGTNFYTSSGTPHAHTGYSSVGSSDLPYAFTPINDLDGSTMVSGQAPYIVQCLDRAEEIKHQFNIYLREWNTYADWVAYGTSLGVTYNPDQTGTEGTNCDYESGFGDNCNDKFDFDDILSGATGGTYNTTTPNAAERIKWFPRVSY